MIVLVQHKIQLFCYLINCRAYVPTVSSVRVSHQRV